LNSHNWLFVVSLIGISFLGCGTSITPNPLDAAASDSANQSRSTPGPDADTGVGSEKPTKTQQAEARPDSARKDERSQPPKSEPRHAATTDPGQQKQSARKKTIRREDAVDLVEYAESNGLGTQFEARTLIEKAGNSDHVLDGLWKLTNSRTDCETGFLEGSPGIQVTDDSELWLSVRVPFRIYIPQGPLGESTRVGIKGARTVVAAKYESRAQPLVLTDESTLRPCSRQEYQTMIVSGKTDNLYYPEADRTLILIAGQFNPELRAFFKTHSTPKDYTATIYFQDLRYGSIIHHQHSCGFYRWGALRTNDWDSDFLMTWNTTGVLTGTVPDYFHTDPAQSPMITSATMLAIDVFDPAGEVLVSADWALDH